MGELCYFWKQSAQENRRYGGKCAPKTSFSGVSLTVRFFLRKNLKTVFGTPFLPKKVIFIFVVRRLVPSKMVLPPKIIFHSYFGKYCFFSKNLLKEEYSKPQRLQKTLHRFLSSDAPLLSKRSYAPTNGFFAVFSENTVSLEKLLV